MKKYILLAVLGLGLIGSCFINTGCDLDVILPGGGNDVTPNVTAGLPPPVDYDDDNDGEDDEEEEEEQ